MNISGAPMYSKEVDAMRNPTAHSDINNKLVFLYPMGIEKTIATTPHTSIVKGEANTLEKLLRSFFSISVLKEIFASNALNLIKTASTYQPNINQEPVSKQLIGSMLRGDVSSRYDGTVYSSTQTTYNPIDSATLQNKVNTKIKDIKNLIKSNQRLRKLNPFMEVITLQNMMDVPVIVGTWPYQMDMTALFTLLSAAIVARKRLDKWENVKYLLNSIRRSPDDSIYKMLQVVINVEKNNSVPGSVLNTSLIGGEPDEFTKLKQQIFNAEDEKTKNNLINRYDELTSDYAKTYIYNLKQDKLKELEISFMYLLDPDRLAARNGLSREVGQASQAVKRLSPQTELLFNRTRQQITDFLSGADSLFSSIYMLFSPVAPINGVWTENSMNYLSMRNRFIDSVSSNFDVFFSTLKSNFETLLSDSVDSASASIKKIKQSCDVAKEEFISSINLFHKTMNDNKIPPSFNINMVQNFAVGVDKLSGKYRTIHKNVLYSLRQFFGDDVINIVESSFKELIDNAIDSYFQPFGLTSTPDTNLQARIYALNSENPGLVTERIHRQLLLQLTLATKLILETIFLSIFKINLCDFVEVADVEFEVTKADVLDPINYCLVIPLELAQALFIIYTKRNWKNAVISSGAGFNPLNSGNSKQVVKLLAQQLGIPNLIVMDNKKGEVLFSFKYLQNNVEKLKLTAVDTFVKYHLQSENEGISQVYY